MKFNWSKNMNYQNTNLINIPNNYRMITEQFCKCYINTYDNDFSKLKNIYRNNSLFTYLGEEIVGFDNYFKKIVQLGIWKFDHIHNTINVNAQPVGKRNILINITGKISANLSNIPQYFVETLMLQRDRNNKFYVQHTIFKLLD